MAIWFGATLIIVGVAPIAIRVAAIYVTAFSEAEDGNDMAWLELAIAGNLWATTRGFIITALGALLLLGGLISRRRAMRK